MARILGIEIPNEKKIVASLPYIYGIGRVTARKILEETNINPDQRTGELNSDQINNLVQAISDNNILIEGELRRVIQANMKRLQSINCYRGLRHRRGLPVRGQRTSTNARTRKGSKKTVGVQRRAGAKKGKV